MALALFDRVQETSTTAGTGSIVLAGAVSGFQSFAVVGNGNTCYYTIVDGSAWEVGVGTYSTSGPTLARTTILSNSNGNTSPLTLTANSKSVFLTYPASKSVNLNESGNVSPLGTVVSGIWNGTTIGVAYGGTGVTTSSGANSVVLRDSNQNITVNRINQGIQTITASGGTTVLTAASQFNQALVGTGGQTFRLPDATTLTDTTTFQFNNNATGTLTIQNNAGTTVGSIASGGAAGIALLSNATVGGTWDVHAYIPESVTWGTNALTLGSTVISGGTWQGGTIQTGYGGTGLTSYTSGGAVYANSSSTLTSGTLPITAGGTGNTSGQAASTASSATFNSGGAGDASGTTFNGAAARTISYNTIGAPSTTGTNASGTWGISITGNAATVTNGLYKVGTNAIPAAVVLNTTADNWMWQWASSGSNDWYLGPTTANFGIGGSRLAISSSGSSPAAELSIERGTTRLLEILQANLQYKSNVVLHAGNYNSYAPTLTGGGASGTWGINITGSAGSAGSATTAVNLSGGPVVTGGSTQPYIQLNSSNYTSTYPSYFGVRSDASGDLRMGNNATNDFVAGTQNAGGYFRFFVNNTNTFPTLPNGTLALTMASSGSVTASVDSRAPIFYDSDNTAYYVDPASTSVLSALNLNTAGTALFRYLPPGTGVVSINAPFYWNAATGAINIAMIDNDTGGIVIDNEGVTVYGAGDTGGVFRVIDEDTWQGNGNNVDAATCFYVNANASGGWGRGSWSFYGDVRSPIFYDSNNTAYYADFADTTTSINVNGSIVINNGASSNTHGLKLNGANSRIWFDGRRAIEGDVSGANFQLGEGYTYTTIYNQTRSPIYYDSNDTGFYVDPNGTSRLNGVSVYTGALGFVNAARGSYFGYSSGYGTIIYGVTSGSVTPCFNVDPIANPSGSFNGNGGEVMFRNGVQFISPNSSNNGYNNYFVLQDGYVAANNSLRAPIFYDSGNTSYYVDPTGGSKLNSLLEVKLNADGDFFIGRFSAGAAKLVYAYQSGSDGYLEVRTGADDIVSKLSGYSGTPSYMLSNVGIGIASPSYKLHVSGIGYATSDLRAPIFYDSNNTARYVDPAGDSLINSVIIYGYGSVYSGLRVDWPHAGNIGIWGATGQTLNISNGSSLQVNLVVSGNVTAYSDERRKTDWQNLPSDYVKRLAEVRSGTFLRSDGGSIERQTGVSAQSMENLLPESVSKDEDGYLSLAYGNAAMVSAVELAKYVTALEQRISQLEARL